MTLGSLPYPALVRSTHLVALLDARTDRPFWGRAWLAELMAARMPAFTDLRPNVTEGREALLGWSVVSVLGSQTLVQSRPILRSANADPLTDFLRAEAALTIGAYATGPRDEATPRDVVRTARFRRFVAAATGVDLGEDGRREMLAALPPFLSRDTVGKTDAELMLLRVIADLHANGDYTTALPEPAALRRAIGCLEDAVTTDEPFAVFVGNARSCAVFHRGGTLLAFEPPEAMRPPTRRFSNRGQEGSPAAALVWTAAPMGPTPDGGAERIAAGIVSAETVAPAAIERD